MATNAHTEHPGGGKPQFPPFNKETFASQLVWFAIFFIALYVLISRFAIPRLGGIIEARRGQVEGDLAEANKLKDQSDAALAAYEKSLADARARAQALAGETRDRLNAEAEKSRKALEAQLDIKLVEAEKTIAATKTSAMTNVRGIAVDTAAAIVQQLIGTAPSASAVEAAVADALKR
ncbi:MAG: F0F1 ATP synthase subunit B' [Xanthobacteraceae bacterium]|nr:F0F1 ATP synthase subunit B' [Xanthobacteraceae bacterium]